MKNIVSYAKKPALMSLAEAVFAIFVIYFLLNMTISHNLDSNQYNRSRDVQLILEAVVHLVGGSQHFWLIFIPILFLLIFAIYILRLFAPFAISYSDENLTIYKRTGIFDFRMKLVFDWSEIEKISVKKYFHDNGKVYPETDKYFNYLTMKRKNIEKELQIEFNKSVNQTEYVAFDKWLARNKKDKYVEIIDFRLSEVENEK